MASNEDTPEARAFQEHYSTLVSAIQDPDTLADQLFSKRIISREVLVWLQTPGLSNLMKNRKILQCVLDRIVFVDSSSFWVLTDVLKHEAYTEPLSNMLEASCLKQDPQCVGTTENPATLPTFFQSGFVPPSGTSHIQFAGAVNLPQLSTGGCLSVVSPSQHLQQGPMSTVPQPAVRMRLGDTQIHTQGCVPPSGASHIGGQFVGAVNPPQQSTGGKQSVVTPSHLLQQAPTPTVSQPAVKRMRMDDNHVQTEGAVYQNYCSNVCVVYRRTPLEKEDSWPPMRKVNFINLAILKSEKLSLTDDYTLLTIQ